MKISELERFSVIAGEVSWVSLKGEKLTETRFTCKAISPPWGLYFKCKD